MEVVHARCGELDGQQRSVVACVLWPGAPGRVERAVRPFGTMTDDLAARPDRLPEQAVRAVVREATGVSWPPVSTVLARRGGGTVGVGPAHFATRDAERVQRRAIQRLEHLGFTVARTTNEDAA